MKTNFVNIGDLKQRIPLKSQHFTYICIRLKVFKKNPNFSILLSFKIAITDCLYSVFRILKVVYAYWHKLLIYFHNNRQK